jgi:hypothetical protein
MTDQATEKPIPIAVSARSTGGAAGTSTVILIFVSGLIISLYALGLSFLLPHSNAEQKVQQTALLCASRLAKVNVKDPQFGRVALADSIVNGETVRSLNSLYVTLRKDRLIAEALHLPQMAALIDVDCQHLHQIEQRLKRALLDEVNPDLSRQTDSIYASAWSELSRLTRVRGRKLLTLNVRLGNVVGSTWNSGIHGAGETDTALIGGGCYKALTSLPIDDSNSAYLYQLPGEPSLCAVREFTPMSLLVTPSAVLLEATYIESSKSRSNGNEIPIESVSACAVAGAPPAEQQGGSLLLSFPHGLPRSLRNIAQLLYAAGDHKGDWRQASGGCVPGAGHLITCMGPIDSEQSVAPACQTALYHFLFSQGPSISNEQVKRLVTMALPRAAQEDVSSLPIVVNSALAKETGARRFAFLNLTGPGEVMQKALRNAFAGAAVQPDLPPSAVPLQVSPSSGCHLAGRRDFMQPFIESFLAGLYRTNMAGVESASVAQVVDDRLQQAIKQTASQIYMRQEELYSVSSRLVQAESDKERASARQISELKRGQSQLALLVKELQRKIDDYQRIRNRTHVVIANAKYAQKVTCDICSRMSIFAHDGIFACHSPDGYLLSSNQVFMPKTDPITEEELYAKLAPPSNRSWIATDFSVLKPALAATRVEQTDISNLAGLRFVENPSPEFLLVDGKDLSAGHALSFQLLKQSPFADSGIGEGQLVYYAANGFDTSESGFGGRASPAVAWSLLLRDQSFLQASLRPDGMNLPSFLTIYSFQGQPFARLGLEMQIRTPVPVVPDLPVGTFLVDPDSKQRVPQIPPIPPRML